jgi:hypothetical protein
MSVAPLTMVSDELQAIFEADQADRRGDMFARDPQGVMERDRLRRERVDELLSLGALQSGADYFHAAMVFQHGSSLRSYRQAHALASRSRDLGDTRAAWLAAASLDRWLTTVGKPQRFGTQFHGVEGRWELLPVDPTTTDEERAEWNVPSLAEQRQQAEQMTRDNPPTWSAMPSSGDVTIVVVSQQQLSAQEPLAVIVDWSDEPVMVPLVGLGDAFAEMGELGMLMIKLDGAGPDQSDLLLRLVVAEDDLELR